MRIVEKTRKPRAFLAGRTRRRTHSSTLAIIIIIIEAERRGQSPDDLAMLHPCMRVVIVLLLRLLVVEIVGAELAPVWFAF